MKVFFSASQRGKEEFGEYYERIYKTIDKLGYTNLDPTFLSTTPTEFYQGLGKKGREANVEFYNRNIARLKAADINVFEGSFHSLSIGFMIVKSIDFNKPTIVLYLDGRVPHFLAGTEEEKLLMRSYKKDNLEKIIEQSLQEAKQRSDKRFNFFISPQLLSYLNKVAKDQGITKSTFIRNLILDHKRRG